MEYEALYLCLQTADQFCDNVRCEMDRSSKRQYEKNYCGVELVRA